MLEDTWLHFRPAIFARLQQPEQRLLLLSRFDLRGPEAEKLDAIRASFFFLCFLSCWASSTRQLTAASLLNLRALLQNGSGKSRKECLFGEYPL